ncbi:hypothetical protein [Streptomyces prasinus]|uniref:hypothetical protein n=1 Tax=Streptomyces prasinus TaxID=67345 RepID=UPI002F415E3E
MSAKTPGPSVTSSSPKGRTVHAEGATVVKAVAAAPTAFVEGPGAPGAAVARPAAAAETAVAVAARAVVRKRVRLERGRAMNAPLIE